MASVGTNKQERSRKIISWAVRIVFAVMFFGAAAFKVSGNPAAIQEFDQVGLGQWFRYFTAACEIGGAGLLLWPRTIAFGATLLGAVCVGAFFAQLLKLHGDVIHAIVMALILGTIVWFYRSQIGFPDDRSPTAKG